MTLDPAVALLLTVAIAALFAVAAAHKLRSPHEFAAAVAAYRLLPDALAPVVARVIPWLELGIATAILRTPGHRYAAALAAMLMAAYGAAIAINLARGRHDLDCGCGLVSHRQPIAGWMVLRNFAVALAALSMLWPRSPRGLGFVDVVTIAAGAAAVGLLYASLDTLLGRVAPRTALMSRR